MDDQAAARWRELARLATDVGPALRPAGHDELVESIAATARRVFAAEACSIAILDGEHLVIYVVAGGSEKVLGQRVPVGTGIAGWVVASGQPLSVADVSNDPRFARDLAERTGYVPTSIVALPLATERATLGVLEVLDARAGEDMELCRLFARQAALALENAQVFDDLGRHLLLALAQAVRDEGLGEALRGVAEERPPADPTLRRIAVVFGELAALDSPELDAAADLLDTYVRHARRRSRLR
jgi:signal transduction protein with GAF and PtsI domain